MSETRKRGRPPRRFITSSGTTYTLAELGISRWRMSNARALASLPEDVFEAVLASGDRRKISSRYLANLARGLPPDHRRGDPLTEALRAALKLTPEDRIALGVAIFSAEDAANLYAALLNVEREAAA